MIESILRTKAPIVAIPVEGHAPVCINGTRLRIWSKGVKHIRVEVEPFAPVAEFEKPKGQAEYRNGVYTRPEGPEHRVEYIVGGRWLKVSGIAGKRNNIRTSARFVAIDRRVAIRELAKWTDKERAKLEKIRFLGALSTSEKKALKRAKYEDEGVDMVPVSVSVGKSAADWHMVSKMGLPVSIPEMPLVPFVVVHMTNDDSSEHFSVVETITGKTLGTDKTAELAIVAARQTVGKQSAESRDTASRILLGQQSIAA